MAQTRPRFEQKLNVAAIYRTNFFTAALWGWVTASRNKGINVTDAIKEFQRHFDIADEDTDSLRRIYSQKNKQLQHTLHDERGVIIICK